MKLENVTNVRRDVVILFEQLKIRLKESGLDNAEINTVVSGLVDYFKIPERPRLNPAGLPDFMAMYHWSANRFVTVFKRAVQPCRFDAISFTIRQRIDNAE